VSIDGGESGWRVGLLGDGRGSRFLIERFADGGPFRVVAAMESLLTEREAARFAIRRERSAREIIRRSDLDLLWATNAIDPESEQTFREGFEHGKHLVCQRSGTLSPETFDRIAADSQRHGRVFLIARPHGRDPDFQQALQFARNCQCDPLRAAKFIAWTYALPPPGASVCPSAATLRSDDPSTAITGNLMSDRLHQLLRLVPATPVEVLADTDAASLDAGHSLLLHIRFSNGCRGEIDLRLDSPMVFQSGWMLTSTRSGYHNGQQFTLTADGELFSAEAASPVTSEEIEPFESLARQLRAGQTSPDQLQIERNTLIILAAARRSLASRQPVWL
jgi:predicted dehydrogenase